MRRFHAVEVYVDQQPAAGTKAVDFLRQERAVGAKVDVFPPHDEALDQHLDFRVDQRLAAADAHDRRPALVGRGQAPLDRQPAVHRVGVLADSSAAGAGEVAGVQRFKHQHQRKLLFARQTLAEQVGGHRAGQGEWETHEGETSVNLWVAKVLGCRVHAANMVSWRLANWYDASVGEPIVPADRIALHERDRLERNQPKDASQEDMCKSRRIEIDRNDLRARDELGGGFLPRNSLTGSSKAV